MCRAVRLPIEIGAAVIVVPVAAALVARFALIWNKDWRAAVSHAPKQQPKLVR
ncbi:MAG: hypothetical protein HOZ81_08340 [Streptomyces sp.]|nr:hypothetical protein [Streptomyces sp.]